MSALKAPALKNAGRIRWPAQNARQVSLNGAHRPHDAAPPEHVPADASFQQNAVPVTTIDRPVRQRATRSSVAAGSRRGSRPLRSRDRVCTLC